VIGNWFVQFVFWVPHSDAVALERDKHFSFRSLYQLATVVPTITLCYNHGASDSILHCQADYVPPKRTLSDIIVFQSGRRDIYDAHLRSQWRSTTAAHLCSISLLMSGWLWMHFNDHLRPLHKLQNHELALSNAA